MYCTIDSTSSSSYYSTVACTIGRKLSHVLLLVLLAGKGQELWISLPHSPNKKFFVTDSASSHFSGQSLPAGLYGNARVCHLLSSALSPPPPLPPPQCVPSLLLWGPSSRRRLRLSASRGSTTPRCALSRDSACAPKVRSASLNVYVFPLFPAVQFDLVVAALSEFANTAILIDQNLNEIAVGARPARRAA